MARMNKNGIRVMGSKKDTVLSREEWLEFKEAKKANNKEEIELYKKIVNARKAKIKKEERRKKQARWDKRGYSLSQHIDLRAVL